jgi:translation initiation factor 3 subunit B
VKNLFSVADCKMHWQKSGDYLCVKVDRYAKAKKDSRDELKFSVRRLPSLLQKPSVK